MVFAGRAIWRTAGVNWRERAGVPSGTGRWRRWAVQSAGVGADGAFMHHYSLRILVIVLGAVALGSLAWKHHRGDRRPKALIAGAVLLVALGFLEYRAQSAEARFGEAVSKVAHRNVAVRCQGMFGKLIDIGQELGTVQFNAEGDPAGKTDIKRDACNWLKAYEKGDKRVTMNAALGVHTLAHEAIHLRGWTDEALAECYGVQYTADVARTLGATSTQAQRLAEFYWRMVYPEMPDEYRTPDCVDGGRLDLHKDSDVWP